MLTIDSTTKQTKKTAAKLFDIFFNTTSPFVFYKIPNSTEIHFLADSEKTIINEPSEILSKVGFVFAPFEENSTTKTIFISNKIHYIYSCQNLDTPSAILNEFNFEVTKYAAEYSAIEHKTPINTYAEKISCAQLEIAKGDLKKVVLADKMQFELRKNIDYIELFKETSETYPDAFVSLVYIPNEGIWLGASPEILISVDKNNIFKTVALAGTKVVKTGDAACDAQWTQKEIHEQALVQRYIVDCFKKIRLREYEEEGPKTVRAGSLWHLKSEFTVNLDEQKFDQLPQVMLKLLHPTSAVCGTPKEKALEIIHKTENFDRVYYAGYLGAVNLPIDSGKETHIYVNLRCAQLINNFANVYIGAGITADSIPEKEVKEIGYKAEIILKVLNKFLKK